jgi:hypothetical protein
MPKLGRLRSLDKSKRSTAEFMRSLGLPMKAIARWLGVNASTLRREMQREPRFRQKMQSARDGLETEILEHLVNAAKTQPGAAKWLRNHYLKIIEHEERLLRGLKQKNSPSSGSANAQKSRIPRSHSESPTSEIADETTDESPSVRCQAENFFSSNAQNATIPAAQNSGPK